MKKLFIGIIAILPLYAATTYASVDDELKIFKHLTKTCKMGPEYSDYYYNHQEKYEQLDLETFDTVENCPPYSPAALLHRIEKLEDTIAEQTAEETPAQSEESLRQTRDNLIAEIKEHYSAIFALQNKLGRLLLDNPELFTEAVDKKIKELDKALEKLFPAPGE